MLMLHQAVDEVKTFHMEYDLADGISKSIVLSDHMELLKRSKDVVYWALVSDLEILVFHHRPSRALFSKVRTGAATGRSRRAVRIEEVEILFAERRAEQDASRREALSKLL